MSRLSNRDPRRLDTDLEFHEADSEPLLSGSVTGTRKQPAPGTSGTIKSQAETPDGTASSPPCVDPARQFASASDTGCRDLTSLKRCEFNQPVVTGASSSRGWSRKCQDP